MKPGTLKATKAIGWFIDEYQIAQVSMNITNISVTPLHVAFDEVCRAANARGVRVTGTEIVGLIPKRTLIEAGRYFLKKQERSTGISEEEIIRRIDAVTLDDIRAILPTVCDFSKMTAVFVGRTAEYAQELENIIRGRR